MTNTVGVQLVNAPVMYTYLEKNIIEQKPLYIKQQTSEIYFLKL